MPHSCCSYDMRGASTPYEAGDLLSRLVVLLEQMSNLWCAIRCGSHRPVGVPRRGETGMGDEDRGHELPQRVLGAPRASPLPAGSPAAPLLSAELRQRPEAAGAAGRAKAAG